MCDVYNDGDQATIWRAEHRIARKSHRCDGCGTSIKKGATYEVTEVLFEGAWSTEKLCFACWWAKEDFGEEHHQFPSGVELGERLRECFEEEVRGAWTDEDMRWRSYLAGIIRRERAAKRAKAVFERVP